MSDGFGARLAGLLAAEGGRGALCLGIDPHRALLEQWGLGFDAAGVREFGLRAVEAATGAVGILKPQIAFFERHGAAGYAALEDVIRAGREAGLLVIADVKRGDMGTTFEAYADSWLAPGSPLEADAMTVNPYQGAGVLQPAYELAARHGKGVFVLCATSNPESASVQTAVTAAGASVAAAILEDMEARNARLTGEAVPAAQSGLALGPLGVVLGATNRLADFGIDPASAPRTPILAPGFGAQGARLGELRSIYGTAAPRVIASVSRAALDAGPERLASRLRRLGDELAEGAA